MAGKVVALLSPLTDAAHEACSGKAVEIGSFPFLVGRESRIKSIDGNEFPTDRRQSKYRPGSAGYLHDNAKRLQISKKHFKIEQRSGGGFYLVDRSTCGTMVNKKSVRGGRCRLQHGDTITIGTKESEYKFRFTQQA